MKTIWSTIYSFYSNWLHPTFNSLIIFLTNNQYAIYFLLTILAILLIVKRKITIKIFQKVIVFIITVIVILLIIVAYSTFSPALYKFMQSTPSVNTSTPTKSTPKSSPNTQSAPTEQSTPSYTAPKQLYYGGGCSGCYADGCPSNGYSYGGYDVNMYNYYRSLCQQCQCTDSRWQSLWR